MSQVPKEVRDFYYVKHQLKEVSLIYFSEIREKTIITPYGELQHDH